ncbi:hypothetical protein FACS1894121_0300 [Bacteroidia bacterium]|nr:hypothetical protein FACS1894121_0300 [Bacteroidia bacterium]
MAHSKMKIPKICEYCGKPFEAKTVITRYCSLACITKVNNDKKKGNIEKARQQRIIDNLPPDRTHITIPEAVQQFGISKDTIYRLVRKGKIPAINLGERLIRISREDMEERFTPIANRPTAAATPAPIALEDQPIKMYYSQNECYTLNEVTEKYDITRHTLRATISRNSIPQRQIGNFVYIPKEEIDRIFCK